MSCCAGLYCDIDYWPDQWCVPTQFRQASSLKDGPDPTLVEEVAAAAAASGGGVAAAAAAVAAAAAARGEAGGRVRMRCYLTN